MVPMMEERRVRLSNLGHRCICVNRADVKTVLWRDMFEGLMEGCCGVGVMQAGPFRSRWT